MATATFAGLAILMIGGLIGFGAASVCAMLKGNKADEVRRNRDEVEFLRDWQKRKLARRQ
jgi:hypothetical protein